MNIMKVKKLAEKKREQERFLEQEKAKLFAIEKSKLDALVKRSQDYKLANDIRNYLKEFEARNMKDGKIDIKYQNYIKWGRQKADEIDPILNFNQK